MTEEETKAKALDEKLKEADARKRADADRDEARTKADAATGEKLDKMLAGMDSCMKGMDSLSKRMDAIEAAGKKPLEEDPTQLTVADSVFGVGKEQARFADAQARADNVMTWFGAQAPAPMAGESLLAYRQRLARPLQSHSKDFGELDVYALNPEVFNAVENRIYADANEAARNPATFAGKGFLREIKRTDQSGRVISEFVGDGSEIWNPSGPIQLFRGLVPQGH